MTKYAKTYADALYDLASEEKLEDVILKDLDSVCSCLREMPEYRKLLMTPAVSKEERKNLLKEAWQGNINQYTMNFLCMLCDGNAVSELFGCQEEYRLRYNVEKGIIEVQLTSAIALTDAQKDQLLSAVEKKTGKKVNLVEKIDPSVLGGLKLQYAGKEYDGTVAFHLNSISALLSGN